MSIRHTFTADGSSPAAVFTGTNGVVFCETGGDLGGGTVTLEIKHPSAPASAWHTVSNSAFTDIASDYTFAISNNIMIRVTLAGATDPNVTVVAT